MDIGKSFSYPFEDNQWVSKMGLGALISLVPILNFAWTGYMVGILRNIMNGAPQPLPNWDDFGKKFMDGVILAIAGFVYALPILILSCLPLSVMTVPAFLSGSQDTQGLAEALTGVGGAMFAGLACLFAVYGLVLSVIFPAIFVVYAREGTFASCFRLREVFHIIGKNTGAFFTAWGISIVASLVVGLVVGFAQMVLGLIPCVGWVISIILSLGIVVYTSMIYSHLFGQFGQRAYGQAPLVPADQAI